MNEEWRDIYEIPNYSISNRGRVQNKSTGRILKVHLHNGYPAVNLLINGLYSKKTIYQLVGAVFGEEAKLEFMGKPEDRPKRKNLRSWRVDPDTGEQIEL